MGMVHILILPDGIHVCVKASAMLESIFTQGVALPFREAVNYFNQ